MNVWEEKRKYSSEDICKPSSYGLYFLFYKGMEKTPPLFR